MGYLLSGLYGAVKGKIGGVIFSNWKGINTAREYKIPANPQSVAQTAQRTKFAAVVALAQSLLATLITTFWNPFAVQMSGFNAFIKSVFPDVTSTGLLTKDCKVTSGTLEGLTPLGATYDTSTGEVNVNWDTIILGNGLLTDAINVLVINKTDNSVLAYWPAFSLRSAGGASDNINTGLTATNLIAFAFASRGSGPTFVVSDSLGQDCVAP